MSLENPDRFTAWLIDIDLGILYWVMCICRYFMLAIDQVLDRAIGYTTRHGWKKDKELAEHKYECSAQVATVLGRGGYSITQKHQLNNFWLWHDRYVHPEYVLEHDHVTLYGFTPTHAFFCVSEESVNVNDTKDAPFLFVKQFLAARQLVIMPHASAHRLAEKVGDPTKTMKLTFIDNTSRCGSTLLCQLLNTVPNFRVMSEPWAIKLIYSLYTMGQIQTEEFAPLIRTAVRLLCKKEKTRRAEHNVIKNCSIGGTMAPMIKKLFPKADYIFNTRNLKGTLDSFKQIDSSNHPLANVIEYFTGAIYEGIGTFPLDDPEWWRYYKAHRERYSIFIHGILFNFAGQLTSFLREPRMHNLVIYFEDLVADSERECRRLFEHMNIPLEYMPAALEALKQDSQKGTFGERGKRPKISPETFAKLEAYLKYLKVDPRLTCNLSLDSYKELINGKINEK